MSTTQQPEALNLEEFRAKVTRAAREPLLARIAELEDATDIAIERIAELEAQLSAIGAGGVEALRKRECLQQSATVTPEKIRDVFLAHGFTIKPGMDDLKPYVYEAALALLALQTAPPAPAAVAVPNSHTQALKAIAEWPVTDMLLNMDAANMRGIAQRALSATQPAAQGLDAQTTRDAVIQRLTSAGVLEHDGCGTFIASGDASELIDACMALSTHAHHEKGAAAQAVALLATGGQAQAVERIAIDMKQTAELLDLFGGEPTEFTVMQCNGHSGPGLYAYVTEYPEDGASYLGKTDCEAQPAPRAQADAQDTDRWMGIGKAIERACADLPGGTEISVSLEKDAGTVTLIDQNGNEHENFSTDYGFAGVLNEAIDAAIAAQAKQGGVA